MTLLYDLDHIQSFCPNVNLEAKVRYEWLEETIKKGIKMENNILEFFANDHERLDDLFRQFQELRNSDVFKAEDVFREFKQGLQRHIVWEEEILFPVFEEKTGIIGRIRGEWRVLVADV